MRKKIQQYVPPGPTIVWKRDPYTRKWVAVQTWRQGYVRTITVNQ